MSPRFVYTSKKKLTEKYSFGHSQDTPKEVPLQHSSVRLSHQRSLEGERNRQLSIISDADNALLSLS